MYLAEIHGKLPSNVERKEDILTSNVFSFFKYSSRNVFLRALLSLLHIEALDCELAKAEFNFWPNYDDNTQPDMVLIVGNYYLLWEAKYFSDFEEKEIKPKSQVSREIIGGLNEAKTLGKQFYYVVITADYIYKGSKFEIIPPECRKYFKWINWQNIAYILLELLEKQKDDLPNYEFATDFYHLLEKKNLRSFQSFRRLKGIYTSGKKEKVFFFPETAVFRGSFIGFSKVLSNLEVHKPVEMIFFSRPSTRAYFQFPANNIKKPKNNIFFERRS